MRLLGSTRVADGPLSLQPPLVPASIFTPLSTQPITPRGPPSGVAPVGQAGRQGEAGRHLLRLMRVGVVRVGEGAHFVVGHAVGAQDALRGGARPPRLADRLDRCRRVHRAVAVITANTLRAARVITLAGAEEVSGGGGKPPIPPGGPSMLQAVKARAPSAMAQCPDCARQAEKAE